MYAELTRLAMYYEEHGDANNDTVVLLHGGMSGAHTWSSQIKPLSERYRVLVPEQQGHSHTTDLASPLTYQTMANDTIEFIERVVQQQIHLVGHSDGGILALLIAIQRPDLLDRAVLIGANYHKDGLLLPAIGSANSNDKEFTTARERYASVAPEGAGHWQVIFEKTKRMWLTEPTLTRADLAKIRSPVLVMVGDDDVIDHSHSVNLYQALREGQMAMIPGTSHGVKKEKPGIVNSLILEFLGTDILPSSLKSLRTGR